MNFINKGLIWDQRSRRWIHIELTEDRKLKKIGFSNKPDLAKEANDTLFSYFNQCTKLKPNNFKFEDKKVELNYIRLVINQYLNCIG